MRHKGTYKRECKGDVEAPALTNAKNNSVSAEERQGTRKQSGRIDEVATTERMR